MYFDWILFVGSVVILLIPASLIYPAAAKERLSDLHSSRFRLERMLLTWQNWLDLARAALGSFLVVNSAVLHPPGVESDWLAPAITGTLLALAVAAQTIHYRKIFYFTAPVFFIWGLTFILIEPIPALFAIAFSAILARLIDHVDLKFPLMAALAGAAGFLLGGFDPELVLACGLILLPLVLAYACMNTLLCYSNDLAFE